MEPSAQGQTTEPVPTAPPVQIEPAPQQTPPPVPTPQKRSKSWLFIVLGVIVAFGLGMGFEKYHALTYLSKIRLPKISFKSSPKPTPTQTITPSPTPNLVANWKTFSSSDLSFQYPPDWTPQGNLISTSSPNIKLTIVPKNQTLMNECMHQVGTMTDSKYVIKKFIRVTTGEACASGDPNPREIWVLPSANVYSPGISFSYSATNATQAGQLFTQLLSTFTFSPSSGSATGSPSASSYTCPTTEYVDCMPILTPEKQAACSPEALVWYKLNCPNFKGGAL